MSNGNISSSSNSSGMSGNDTYTPPMPSKHAGAEKVGVGMGLIMYVGMLVLGFLGCAVLL